MPLYFIISLQIYDQFYISAYYFKLPCFELTSIIIMSDSDQEARGLFDQINIKDEQQHLDSDSEKDKGSPSKKRQKKHKKDKKRNKKRHYQEQEQEDNQERYEDERVRGYLDIEASQDSNEESEDNSSAQFSNDGQERRHYQEIYKVKKKRQTDKFMERVQGKNQDQINRLYQQKAFKRRQNETMLPSQNDDRMYILPCKQGKEEQLALSILNKCFYYQKTKNSNYKMSITGALALKKKYPGKIFVQASSEIAIKESLEGFIDVNTKKIIPMDNEFYSNLFQAKQAKDIQFKESQYVRVKKGVYEGDLGKISKTRKNNCDIALVPRINVQDILTKMREQISKNLDQKETLAHKDEILRKYTNPRMYYPIHLRPPKKLLSLDVFKDFQDLPSNKKFQLTSQSLIILNFRYDQIAKPQGTMLPIELQPFSKNNNIIQEFQDQEQRKNIVSTIKITKGDEIQIVAGQLTGCYGVIEEVKDNIVVIRCKNKQMAGKMIEQHIEHLSKRFKEGQRVKVVSGTQKGKTGLILKIDGIYAEIWTDNQNSIKINKNNLQIYQGQAIVSQNLLGLKKNDLIKTTKGNIGVVIGTNKDNIKILDSTNVVQIVGNLDYQSKINTHNLVAKNRNGDQIKNQTIVRIRKGIHQGSRCQVKHVYRDYCFLFNPEFDKTSGIVVEKADNCVVVAKTIENVGRRVNSKSVAKPGFGTPNTQEQELKVGKSITIGSGSFKGYRGVIKSINKDKIQVRIPHKNCTEWIHRDKIAQTQSNLDHGKTPRRGLSMTTMYAQSPMNF